jgi:lipoprotein-releasing system permease protein
MVTGDSMRALYRASCYCDVMYVRLLALRYVFAARRGPRRIRAPMLAVSGIMLGAAALTVVLAVTSGFQTEFRDKVLGVNAHVTVQRADTDFANYRQVLADVERADPQIVAAEPYVWAATLATDGHGHIGGVGVKGVDPARVGDILDLQGHMLAGDLETLAWDQPVIIIGSTLARTLRVGVGDDLSLVRHVVDADGTVRMESTPHRVTGIFRVGFDEYDRRIAYTSLAHAQALLGRGDRAHGIELRLRDEDAAPAIARKLERQLPPGFVVESWGELNKNLFDLLRLQKTALVIVLLLIIAVACVNLVSVLTMMVADRKRDIAILGAFGAPAGAIGRVFLIVGAIVGVMGTASGIGLGLLVCALLRSHGFELDPRVYTIDHLPLVVKTGEVVSVAAASMLLCLVVTLPPALRAARLRPARALAEG